MWAKRIGRSFKSKTQGFDPGYLLHAIASRLPFNPVWVNFVRVNTEGTFKGGAGF
jgi:hypothetical protein